MRFPYFICKKGAVDKMKIFMALFAAVLTVLTVSCSSEQDPKKEKHVVSAARFPKLKDYSLELSVVTPRKEYYAGEENVKITFSLKNVGLTPVTLDEWYMFESANINIYYAPGTLAQTASLPEEQWKQSPTYDRKRKRINLRSPLVLNPGTNHALVVVPLTFLKDLRDAGRHVPYTIKGKLNLQSVDVESVPFEITVK